MNVGLLLLVAITSIGVYGIILGGWASNSKYALMGGLRSAAQLISYEVPMGFALVAAILMSRSLSLVGIVEAQKAAHLWFIFPGLLAFFLYFVSGVAETNRIPFDLPEAESELVAGFHTEYSGFRWAVFFLSEYANMITISAIATTLFFGGWLRPFPNVSWLSFLDVIPRIVWFLLKVSVFLFVYIWFRGTFPRYRFDQLMALGWKVLIPLSIGNVVLVAFAALWGLPGLKVLSAVLWVGARRRLPRRLGRATPKRRTRPGGRGVTMSLLDRILLFDIFTGLKITGRHWWRRKDTVPYPEARREAERPLPRDVQARRGALHQVHALRDRVPDQHHLHRLAQREEPGREGREGPRPLRPRPEALHVLRPLRGRVPDEPEVDLAEDEDVRARAPTSGTTRSTSTSSS